ncbi:uncharacterized protein E0L32_008236 [Thyridium curvatum]|uniref:Cytochrome P450 n=1 Tax=Thyridium curvatum TaxID=1093900 RepID=A0A507ATQ7_9PEZI|nr:uncharacterized protein E0L32_008236 [Thyridium curvatum]TPX10847.1 hypothetical protein E0L32_008236 [Thyridium curvatum]
MLLFTPWFWLSAGGFLAVAYIVKCLSSPLRKLPGPAYSIFTSVVLKWHEFHTNRTRYIHRLHQKYGPVVRIGPNEAAFASQTAVKEIYCSGGSGYDKTEFYDLFKVYGRRTMFTTLNKEDHARRRRILADRYANSNVMRQPSLNGIVHRSKNVLKRCTESVGGSLDLYIALHAYAFDCVTHHLFHPYGVDSLQSEKDEEIMREVAFDDSLQNRLVEFYNPLLHKVIGKVLYLFAKPRETPLADDFVLSASGGESPAVFTLLSRMREKQHDMEQLDIAAESLDHMAAGIDTTGDALCFLMWELSQPSSLHLQRRLQQELTQDPDTQFDKLPFLEAVVQEGLRCFPAIPMSLPRYVPRGGRTIDGYFVPEKTVVSCQAYSVHRIDERVFPEPDKFDPDRWLEEEGDAERKRLSFAFANGGRGCIGKQ